MANHVQLEILMQGVENWNKWRDSNPNEIIDLSGTDLSGMVFTKANFSKTNFTWADLTGVDFSEADLSKSNLSWSNLSESNFIQANCKWAILSGADLTKSNFNKAILFGANLFGADISGANLSRAKLIRANLSGAILSEANLSKTVLEWADLSGAKLVGTNLSRARLSNADLSNANLSKANLTCSSFIRANFKGADLSCSIIVEADLSYANLSDCIVYGVSVWNSKLDHAIQHNLIPTRSDETVLTVDDLEVAQFFYLLINNQKIKKVIDTISSKAVLILGRFTPERKVVLESIRAKLRESGYLPILFDFEKPESQDYIEPVSTLAHLSRFVIADVTNPKIVLEELDHIVRNIAVPVIPLLLNGSGPEPTTLYNLRYIQRFWLLDTHVYKDVDDLLKNLEEKVIAPAEARARDKINRGPVEIANSVG